MHCCSLTFGCQQTACGLLTRCHQEKGKASSEALRKHPVRGLTAPLRGELCKEPSPGRSGLFCGWGKASVNSRGPSRPWMASVVKLEEQVQSERPAAASRMVMLAELRPLVPSLCPLPAAALSWTPGDLTYRSRCIICAAKWGVWLMLQSNAFFFFFLNHCPMCDFLGILI